MAAKLSDREFAERARASAARRAERVRLRRLAAGRVAVTQWIPVTAKQRLDALATAFSQTPADVLTTAIMALPMPAAAPTQHDEVHALAKEVTATPAESLPLFEESGLVAVDAINGAIKHRSSTVPEDAAIDLVLPAKAPTEPAQPDRDAAIIAAHAQGLSLAGISQTLAAQGIVTNKGNPISKDTVNKILKKAHLKANGV